MAGNVAQLSTILTPDRMGVEIANRWVKWRTLRAETEASWEEVRRYLFATSTRSTTNSKLEWKNTTTTPKMTQIRDNLFANYRATMRPTSEWLIWEGADEESNAPRKQEATTAYMGSVIEEPQFEAELEKCIFDYIDYGNSFSIVEWLDETVDQGNRQQYGYIGPTLRRISPLDIVFNPIATSFENSPKIVRSLVSLGEAKKIMDSLSNPDTQEAYDELWNYMIDVRGKNGTGSYADDTQKDTYLRVDGFSNYTQYLESDFAEILTFYGDMFDPETNELMENYVIMVVDRHRVIFQGPNNSVLGRPALHHVGWRRRQDNLWAMGPLENLVGLQYRIDHLENLKADVFDLLAFPPLKIKGQVDDFKWGPMEKIYVSEEGDIEILSPNHQILQTNLEIDRLIRLMEEMAGAPKEAMGFRTPGEKTKYEVQSIENAASRIFQSQVSHFERNFVEPSMNDMLELARRLITTEQAVRVFDKEFMVSTFFQITPGDLSGVGRIKPIAARHFAEQAQMVQNLNQFFSSPLGQDPANLQHVSSVKLMQVMFDDLFGMKQYGLVQPYVRIPEMAEAERIKNSAMEQVAMEAQTPSGLNPDDYDPDLGGALPNGASDLNESDQALLFGAGEAGGGAGPPQ